MGFTIKISKTDELKLSVLKDKIDNLCEGVVVNDNSFIYLPLSGKVIHILKIFVENDVKYELKDGPMEAVIR
jgi:hypothetical protein